MFKKPFKISQKHNLNGKDFKKLKKDITGYFDKEAVKGLFSEMKTLQVNKIEKCKVVIFKDSEDPLLVDLNSKGEYFPTIYAVFRFPLIVPVIFKLKPGVESFLYKGANLMWPGVMAISTNKYRYDDLVAIVTYDGFCCAVGSTASDGSDVKSDFTQEGICAYTLHYYGDELYNFGSKSLRPKVAKILIEEEAEEEEVEKGIEKEKEEDKASNNEEIIEEVIEDAPVLEEEEEKAVQEHEQEKSLVPEDFDQLIREAFLNAVKLTMNKDLLPIENSQFWNKHINPCRTTEEPLNIKNSTYKKLGKLFQTFEKEGLIKYKEASKKVATPQITKIIFTDPVIAKWVPTIKEPLKIVINKPDSDEKPKQLINDITNYCKTVDKLKQFIEGAPDDYIPYEEMLSLIGKTLKNKGLMNKNTVIITEDMTKSFKLNKSLPKKDKTQKNVTMSYQAFLNSIDRLFAYKHRIYDPVQDIETVKPGKFIGILISAERNHNKYITRILNCEEYGIKLEELLSILQIKYGTSGTIQSSPIVKSHNREINLQGVFLEELKDFLISTFGIRKRMIDVVNKSGKTKKKDKKR